MASLMISAAVPWIGVFMAHRSAKLFLPQSSDTIPGKYLLRPSQVSLYLRAAACLFVASCQWESCGYPAFKFAMIFSQSLSGVSSPALNFNVFCSPRGNSP